MNWDHCKRNFIKKVEVDFPKIKSILEVVDNRLNFLESSQINENNVSFVVEGYYEVIKELLSALTLKEGMKLLNHQCLFSYFYRKYPEYEAEARFILRLNSLRNGLNYYGRMVDFNWYKDNLDEIKKVIKLLKKLLSGL